MPLVDQYALPAAVTLAGIHQLGRFTKVVGAARMKFQVPVPETTGPPEFVRTYRAHQNSLEFFPMTTTAMWIGAVFVHPVPSSLMYAGYLFGRERYFKGYVEESSKRLPGFYLSIRFFLAMNILCVAGIVHKLVRNYGNIDLWQLFWDRLPIGQC